MITSGKEVFFWFSFSASVMIPVVCVYQGIQGMTPELPTTKRAVEYKLPFQQPAGSNKDSILHPKIPNHSSTHFKIPTYPVSISCPQCHQHTAKELPYTW